MSVRRAMFLSLGIVVGARALTASEPPKPPSPPSLALIGDEPITDAEVEALVGPQLAELRQKIFQLRSQGLDELIAQRLAEREAKRRGLTVEGLVKVEVDDKVVVTEADLRTVYEANKSRFGTQSEAEAFKQIEPAVRQQKRRDRQMTFVHEMRTGGGGDRAPRAPAGRAPRARRVARTRLREGARHDRRVFGFPVPLLRPRPAHLEAGPRGLRREGPLRLRRLSPRHPSRGQEGPRGRGLRPRAGQVLADVRPAVHERGQVPDRRPQGICRGYRTRHRSLRVLSRFGSPRRRRPTVGSRRGRATGSRVPRRSSSMAG